MDIDIIGPLKKEKQSYVLAGSDEVGRGPLAGPVIAATVIAKIRGEKGHQQFVCFLEDLKYLGVTDSKKLTAKKRAHILSSLKVDLEKLVPGIKYQLFSVENLTVEYSLSEISNSLIDEINILNASLLAMEKSFRTIYEEECGVWAIDGNKAPQVNLDNVSIQTIVKGDSKVVMIAVASIIAKEFRDALMVKYDELYPGYGLAKHAGYPTKFHKEQLINLGITPIHRKSFKGVKEWVNH